MNIEWMVMVGVGDIDMKLKEALERIKQNNMLTTEEKRAYDATWHRKQYWKKKNDIPRRNYTKKSEYWKKYEHV